jgi:hypothetical protein
MTPWRYVGNATSERLARLESPNPYPALLAALKFHLLHAFTASPNSETIRMRAPISALILEPNFSMRSSMRRLATGARYFVEPERGLAANRELIAELSPVLAEWGSHGARSWTARG